MFPRGGEFHQLQLGRGSRQTEKGENCLYESRNKTLEETLPSEEGGGGRGKKQMRMGRSAVSLRRWYPGEVGGWRRHGVAILMAFLFANCTVVAKI
jgi:hypothetical protein